MKKNYLVKSLLIHKNVVSCGCNYTSGWHSINYFRSLHLKKKFYIYSQWQLSLSMFSLHCLIIKKTKQQSQTQKGTILLDWIPVRRSDESLENCLYVSIWSPCFHITLSMRTCLVSLQIKKLGFILFALQDLLWGVVWYGSWRVIYTAAFS